MIEMVKMREIEMVVRVWVIVTLILLLTLLFIPLIPNNHNTRTRAYHPPRYDAIKTTVYIDHEVYRVHSSNHRLSDNIAYTITVNF